MLDAKVPVAPSSDAPYGPLDRQGVMEAAQHRLSPSGTVAGSEETIASSQALACYLCEAASPGGVARRVTVGTKRELIVLATTVKHVRATSIDGIGVHRVRPTRPHRTADLLNSSVRSSAVRCSAFTAPSDTSTREPASRRRQQNQWAAEWRHLPVAQLRRQADHARHHGRTRSRQILDQLLPQLSTFTQCAS